MKYQETNRRPAVGGKSAWPWIAWLFLLICLPWLANAAGEPTAKETAGPPYQATGVKLGEVDQTHAIVWTRLTRNPERLKDGFVIPKKPGASEGDDEAASPKSGKGKAKGSGKSKETGKVEGSGKSKGSGKKQAASSRADMPPGVALDQLEGATPGAPGQTRVVYWAEGKESQKIETPWTAVDPQHDFTRQFRLANLTPNTDYSFRVECRAGEKGPLGPSIDGRFRTAPLPDDPARVVFTVITGQNYWDRDGDNGHKIYPQMEALKPSFFAHTGDILYYDSSRPFVTSADVARFVWSRLYSLPLLVHFHRFVPSYFEKDDHDTWQNDCWPTLQNDKMGTFTFKEGQQIFLDEVPMGDSTIRTYRWGKDLQIWLPEGRDFRSPNTMPDGPDKTIWGTKQKEWFKRTVQESDATFRVLISPTPIVGPDREAKADNHANKAFAHEGKEIRQFVAAQKNMYIVCGDRHWQYVSVDPETGAREYSCGPTTDKHSGGFNEMVPAYHKYFKLCGGFLSGTVERVGGVPTLTFQHHDVGGKVLHEDRLPAK